MLAEQRKEIKDLKSKLASLNYDDIDAKLKQLESAGSGRNMGTVLDFERTAKHLNTRIDDTGDMSQKEFVRLKERLRELETKPGNLEEELNEFKKIT